VTGLNRRTPLQRGGPLRRGAGLTADPDQVRAWQQRSRRQPPASTAARPDGSAWRTAVLAARGELCSVPGCGETRVDIDHLIPRAAGGPWSLPNGWPLCSAWSRTIPGGHHAAKTAHTLRICRAWLAEDQLAWLEERGAAWWDPATGEVWGKHRRLFVAGY
jgi:hypothetical protein